MTFNENKKNKRLYIFSLSLALSTATLGTSKSAYPFAVYHCCVSSLRISVAHYRCMNICILYIKIRLVAKNKISVSSALQCKFYLITLLCRTNNGKNNRKKRQYTHESLICECIRSTLVFTCTWSVILQRRGEKA